MESTEMMKYRVILSRRASIPGLLIVAVVAQASVMADLTPKGSRHATAESSKLPLMLKITPRFALVGESVQAVVRVRPDVENRLLRITVDSFHYFRSSDVTLNGADSAQTHLVPLNSLPAGSYTVLAVVYGTQGERARSEETFALLGLDVDRPSTADDASRRHPRKP
jgi:hypothetical protein